MHSLRHVGLTILTLMLLGCSGNSATDDTGSDTNESGISCETAYEARCKRACECQSGAQCSFAPASWNKDGGVVIVPASVMESEQSCLSMAKMVKCVGGGDREVDYEACQDSVTDTPCESFEIEGKQYKGMAAVRECHE